MTVLLTGASGFIGSALAEELLLQDYKVIALKRSTSNLWRCSKIMNKIKWVNYDHLVDFEAELSRHNPDVLIHSAWNGVKSSDRDDWFEQEKNLPFLINLLELSKKTNIRKIIAIGSQAEYGLYDGIVDEKSPCKPISAYGLTKLYASSLLKWFAQENNLDWYWIRLFSIFGPKEDEHWLISSAINNLLNGNEMKLTPCEQRYDYLYIKDLTCGVIKILKNESRNSGTYNLSSCQSIRLKDILQYLESKISPHRKLLQIGTLDYRPNQVMHMEGNSELFFNTFDFRPTYSLSAALEETINYYVENRNERNR
jgi:nucleoside-diphosphate-sugar epimerase